MKRKPSIGPGGNVECVTVSVIIFQRMIRADGATCVSERAVGVRPRLGAQKIDILASMDSLYYQWTAGGETHALDMIHVPGTAEMPAFYIGAVPVTQALWLHVMGDNPSKLKDKV